MLLLFVLFLPLVTSDSIILQNDCKRTSELCFITLEVIKGQPQKDCSIFSTVDRLCTVGIGEVPTARPSDQEIQVTETGGQTMVSWTGQKVKGNRSETNSLSASSIWQRIKRQVKGQVVNCTCTPVRRQKRDVWPDGMPLTVEETDMAYGDIDGCPMGYLPTARSIDPLNTLHLPTLSFPSVEDCAASCEASPECDSFAFMASSTTSNCVYLNGLADVTPGPFIVYEKC